MRQQVQNDRTAIRRCARSSPKKKARREIQQRSLNDPQLAKVIKAGLSKATARTFWGDGFITSYVFGASRRRFLRKTWYCRYRN